MFVQEFIKFMYWDFFNIFLMYQALLTFWYHVANGCEENVAFITDTTQVANNIPFNYIL